jgi:dTMP kinase
VITVSKGKFITFEGGEASGKSTQANLLSTRLRAEGVMCWQTKEPGGTGLGNELRKILKYSSETIDPITEVFLFGAARLHHVPLIREKIHQGCVVVCDRYSDSTIAYQCYGRATSNCNYDETRQLVRISERGLIPNITFYLSLGVEESIARMKDSTTHSSRFDKEPSDFHERIILGFDALARENPHRIITIDASLGVEDVAARIWDEYISRYPEGE